MFILFHGRSPNLRTTNLAQIYENLSIVNTQVPDAFSNSFRILPFKYVPFALNSCFVGKSDGLLLSPMFRASNIFCSINRGMMVTSARIILSIHSAYCSVIVYRAVVGGRSCCARRLSRLYALAQNLTYESMLCTIGISKRSGWLMRSCYYI